MNTNRSHSPNCLCGSCTSHDSHIAHVRSQFGKNANFENTINGGSQFGYNQYESNHFANHADPATPPIVATKANLKQILGEALGSVVGNLIQAKKDGETLPKALDVVASLGIKTEQAAINAATGKAQNEVGKQVLAFSPYIIAGLVGVVLLVVVLLAKK